ncbi:MAG TPA: MaoC family dehydratase [Beijerinckiaceae bacterium]|nr:MaoC family dehydratase [Beijerinckiaceae bacterium]
MTVPSAYFRQSDGAFRERFGLSFEDFSVGQRFLHRPGITLSQQENVEESLDTLNAAMLHYDAHYAAQTAWKRPLLVSTITLKRAIGMGSKTLGRRRAILRFDEIAMTAPLFGGDTIYSESEVLDIEPGDRSDCGTVRLRTSAVKADGIVAGRFVWLGAFWRRGHGPDAEPGTPCETARFSAFRKLENGALMEEQGLFYEDFEEGDCFIHYPRRSFSEVELIEQTRRALDLSPFWQDPAQRSETGALRVPEPVLIGAATALTTRTFGRVVANLGWTDTELPAPVFAGDTIEARSRIVARRDSRSRPGEGVLTVDTSVRNQRDVTVLSFRRNLLVYRRSSAPYAQAGY